MSHPTLPEIPGKIARQVQNELTPLKELWDGLWDLPGMAAVLQKTFDSALPKLTPENARILERMAFRISAGLPPLADRAIPIHEFKGSLS